MAMTCPWLKPTWGAVSGTCRAEITGSLAGTGVTLTAGVIVTAAATAGCTGVVTVEGRTGSEGVVCGVDPTKIGTGITVGSLCVVVGGTSAWPVGGVSVRPVGLVPDEGAVPVSGIHVGCTGTRTIGSMSRGRDTVGVDAVACRFGSV